MKHDNLFKTFMEEEVNLNSARLEKLEGRLETIRKFLKESELLKDNIIDIRPQGSYAHKTIIKPRKQKEFDVDILVFLTPFAEWEPKDYIHNIYHLFKNNGNYEDIVYRQPRCILLDYADDFHIDIVPCIEEDGDYSILNKNTNEPERTDGDGYDNWLKGQNAIVGNNQLRKVTKLAKFIRDTKGTFSAKSILLTTLLGERIDTEEDSSEFSDLPTSLKTVFNRLNTFLQENPEMPIIENPVLEGENFTRHWDQDKYSNFRNQIETYTDKINAAFDEQHDRQESIKKWQEIFGGNFGKSTEESKTSSNTVVQSAPAGPWRA